MLQKEGAVISDRFGEPIQSVQILRILGNKKLYLLAFIRCI